LTRDPWSYQQYIRDSKAEFSVAKHGYVASCSGWFSERSAAYLAAGRPVVTEDTGFSRWLQCGSGVIAFKNVEQASAGVEDVAANYDAHCRAAREVVAAHFDSRSVLPHLLKRAL
jgi:hypothetical protein